MGGLHFTAACLLVLQIVTIGARHVCQQKPNRGYCNLHQERYYFDSMKLKCRKFFFGSCRSKGNNFGTKEACMNTCFKEYVCRLKPKTGFCFAYMERFYFDSREQACKVFIYGGCDSNGNNFDTKETCMNTCFKGHVCEQKPDTGNCLAYYEKYYFDSKEQACKKFVYGGCGGNDNKFDTKEMCMNTCFKGHVCKQKPDTGNCLGYYEKYYFDSKEQACRKFVYGGCGGNDNKFDTKEMCMNTCFKRYQCHLPAEAGPCLAAFSMYHYNKYTQSCEIFTYGGCKGNLNRFISKKECEDFCMH